MNANLIAIAAATTALTAGLVFAQDYPSKPIRIITAAPGGGGDFASRQIAQGIAGPLGQPVIVENRAQGILAAEFVSKAPADGYTLTTQGGSFWIQPLFRKVPYDALKDFVPISQVTREVYIVVVHPSLPTKSIKELIALAKARPGALNYATPSPVSTSFLATELFKSMASVNIVHVPYKGGAPAAVAMVSGEAQLLISDANLLAPHVKAGRLRALAVTSAQPSALFPGLATVAASGVPGYEMEAMTGIFAPGKTPRPIVNRLHLEIVRVLNLADVKERYLSVGIETVGSTPEEFAAAIKAESTKLAKVIKDTGIKIE